MRIGVVLSDEATPNQSLFRFVATKEVSAGQIVEARTHNQVFVAIVTSVHMMNPDYGGISTLHHILTQKPEVAYDPRKLEVFGENIIVATAQILGTFNIGSEVFDFTGDVVSPGSEIHIAEKKRLLKIISDKQELTLGKIHTNPDVDLEIPTSSLLHHIAIVGSTGSGKSYAGAVLCEELAKNSLPIVVIDCHGEYSSLGTSSTEKEQLASWGLEPTSFNVVEFTPRKAFTEGTKEFSIRLSHLSVDDIVKIMDLPGERQRILLYTAFERFLQQVNKGKVSDDITGLFAVLKDVGAGFGDTLLSTSIRLSKLNELGVLGEGVLASDIINPSQISIINVSGLDAMSEDVLVGSLIRLLFSERREGNIPSFILLVEEVHRYAPEASTPTKTALSTIIKEGRKFGIGVVVLSQRPSDIDTTILTQCNTILVLKLVDKTDLDRIKSRLSILSNLAESLQFFPAGRGIISGYAVRFPLLIQIRRRKSSSIVRKRETKQLESKKLDLLRSILPKKPEKKEKAYKPITNY